MKQSTASLCLLLFTSVLSAQDADVDRVREASEKGLAWLASKQAKDGSWPASQGMPSAHTALSGMAFLAAGNTLTEGKYAPNLRKALGWYVNQKPKEAIHAWLLGNDPSDPDNSGRYMPQHGVALSFLVQLYLEEVDTEDRKAMRKLIEGGVAFSLKGQSSLGGWFYTSTAEGHDSVENVATMLVIQGLMDAREAGIAVPRAPMSKARAYLERCTTERGGIVYSGGWNPAPAGGERPTITAMALAAYLPKHGPYTDETTRRWLAFCADTPRLAPVRKMSSTDLLTQYFVSKVAFQLSDRAWRDAFPNKKIPDHLNWSKYKAALHEHLLAEQNADGSWSADGWTMGPLFATTMALNILLYEQSYRLPLSR